MKTKFGTSGLLLGSALGIAIITTGIFYTGKSKAMKNLDNEKIRNEKLLSEKIRLDEMLENMKVQLNTLSGTNAELDKLIAQKLRELEKKEVEINRLKAENGSVAAMKKKLAEMEVFQQELMADLNRTQKAYNDLLSENSKLNGQLTSIQGDNDLLTLNNAILKAIAADNYRVEALKGKHDKPTLNARKTDKLIVSFDMPSSVSENINFRITAPNGNEMAATMANTTINSAMQEEYLLASSERVAGMPAVSRTELVYKPKEKLEKGVYLIRIYNGEEYVGSTQLRLR